MARWAWAVGEGGVRNSNVLPESERQCLGLLGRGLRLV